MNLWEMPGVPHKGWICTSVYDTREGEEPGDEPIYATCEMCGHEQIRYVHVMSHPQYQTLEVGCVCAVNMSGDYVGPKEREKHLVNRAARRKNWLTRKWKRARSGNYFLKVNGKNVGVFPDKFNDGMYKWFIGGTFSDRRYQSPNDAALALFDALYPSRVIVQR